METPNPTGLFIYGASRSSDRRGPAAFADSEAGGPHLKNAGKNPDKTRSKKQYEKPGTPPLIKIRGEAFQSGGGDQSTGDGSCG
jgi:hypothetical protein